MVGQQKLLASWIDGAGTSASGACRILGCVDGLPKLVSWVAGRSLLVVIAEPLQVLRTLGPLRETAAARCGMRHCRARQVNLLSSVSHQVIASSDGEVPQLARSGAGAGSEATFGTTARFPREIPKPRPTSSCLGWVHPHLEPCRSDLSAGRNEECCGRKGPGCAVDDPPGAEAINVDPNKRVTKRV